MADQRWDEYFYEWTWPEETRSAKDLAREVLGVSQSADIREIKRVYRELARQLHPDTDPSDKSLADRFRVISEAYEILTTKRNVRTRKLAARNPSEAGETQPEPYPEWWSEHFRDLL